MAANSGGRGDVASEHFAGRPGASAISVRGPLRPRTAGHRAGVPSGMSVMACPPFPSTSSSIVQTPCRGSPRTSGAGPPHPPSTPAARAPCWSPTCPPSGTATAAPWLEWRRRVDPGQWLDPDERLRDTGRVGPDTDPDTVRRGCGPGSVPHAGILHPVPRPDPARAARLRRFHEASLAAGLSIVGSIRRPPGPPPGDSASAP